MKKPTFVKRAGGFTLVELMVCIVIVICLAAMVFALTRNAMAKSKLGASQTRVRDLGVRIQAYTQDNAGQLPVWKNSDELYWWAQLMKDPRDVNEMEIFHSQGHDEWVARPSNPNISYGWNAHVVGRTDAAEGDEGPKRLANFKEPARILVLADGPAKNPQALLDGDTNKPDPDRYVGKAAGLLLDGSSRQLEIHKEFASGQSPWLMTEAEREASGK